MSDARSFTQLLEAYRGGDEQVIAELMTLAYESLRKVARNQLRQRAPQTLTPTGLVHEAFLSLNRKEGLKVEDREHFFALAARCMRWVLADRAKLKAGQKRGGGKADLPFDEMLHQAPAADWNLVALDDALTRLAKEHPRLAQIAELRFLAGLSVEETAAALKISPATVKRDWQLARAWLSRSLRDEREAA